MLRILYMSQIVRIPASLKEKPSLDVKAALHFIHTFSTRTIENPDKVIYEQIKCEFTAYRLTLFLVHFFSKLTVPTVSLTIFLKTHCANQMSLICDFPYRYIVLQVFKILD